MNILYINWKCLGADDAMDALKELGHNVNWIELSDKSHEKTDWDFVEQLVTIMKKHHIELAFSFNFFPTIAQACNQIQCSYLSIVYDSPYIKTYDLSVSYKCNFVFTFDYAMYQELKGKGIDTIHYAPLAVNIKRLSSISLTPQDKKLYTCDVAFVGSLYNEKHNLYDRLISRTVDNHLIGFLEGLLEAQQKVFGYNFLRECLTKDILMAMYRAMPFVIEKDSYADLSYVYSDYFLCRKLSSIERVKFLSMLSDSFQLHLYTNNPDTMVGKCINKGKVHYYTQMPNAFRCAKINLNITLRSIKTGIPLRAMDILGSGGFLLTNYQEDFLRHFEPDRDFVYFGSPEELYDKTAYYIKHDSERKQISENGYQRVKQEHSYVKRLKDLLHIIQTS